MSDTGRPSIYTAELSDRICQRLAGGESLRSICRDETMPAISSVMLWVVDGKHEEFSEHYARARQANGQAHGDRVADLVDMVISGEIEPQAAKVAMDGLKWSAERMAPKQYSNKQQLELTGKDGGAIEVEMSDRDKARRIAFLLAKGVRENEQKKE